jgi:pilus assembly protein TadC
MGVKVPYAEEFGQAFVFKNLRPKLRSYYSKAGSEEVPYHKFGLYFYLSIAITYIIYMNTIMTNFRSGFSPFLLLLIYFFGWIGIQLVVLAFVAGIEYFSSSMKIFNRTKEIEKHFPDFLQLVSSNLKGGLSFEKSLYLAIRPEFRCLSNEIYMVTKKTMTGNELSDSLSDFCDKYESPEVRRSINLIIGELDSGGKITEIVDKVIADMRKTTELKAEMSANTLTYMIFIGLIVIAIAPVLFSLSLQLLQVILGITSTLASSGIGGLEGSPMTLTITEVNIDPDDFKLFSVGALSIISIFAAMIVSIIEKGNIRGGVKYIPLFWVLSLIVYILSSKLLGSIFGGMM